MSDMMMVIASRLKERPELADVTIKPYYRPESLAPDKASLVIVPMAPPRQADFGSDKVLRKRKSVLSLPTKMLLLMSS